MTPDVLLDIPESLYLRSISPFSTSMQRGSQAEVVRMYKLGRKMDHSRIFGRMPGYMRRQPCSPDDVISRGLEGYAAGQRR